MKYPRRIVRNFILPGMILVPLITVMIGCIYVPTFDHTLLTGTKKDFRRWASDHQKSPPQKLATFTRSGIESLFGRPAFVSQNGTSIAYVMGSEHGIAIWPLCFGAGFTDGQTHVLKLVFDKDGGLNRVIPLEGDREPPTYYFGSRFDGLHGPMPDDYYDPNFRARDLIRDDNKTCPPDAVIEIP